MKAAIALCVLALSVLAVSGELPEEKLDTIGIINYWQYPAELHTVTTTDGYILTLHRIPYGKDQSKPTSPRKVVFMQHGLEASSSNWVTNLPKQSAGFIFADAGYDVWLGNFRGNTYSKAHAWLPVNSKEYWAFSWDEMAQYDLPTMLNYVLNVTEQENLHYIGHSMGTMTAFALFSEDHSWESKIVNFHALAPVAKVGHIGGIMKLIAPLSTDIGWVLKAFGENQFLPSDAITKWLAKYVCGLLVTVNPVCDDILFLIAGPDSKQLNKTRVPVYVAHTPAGTSTQNILHFAQGVNHDTYSKYDYGSAAKNELHYHQSTPPSYDLTKVNVPTYLYWGQEDILADPTDVTYIANTLPASTLKGNQGFADFDHLDFIWGERAAAEVYAKILTLVKAGN